MVSRASVLAAASEPSASPSNEFILDAFASSGTALTADLYNSESVPKLRIVPANAAALTPLGRSNITGNVATVACFVKSNEPAVAFSVSALATVIIVPCTIDNTGERPATDNANKARFLLARCVNLLDISSSFYWIFIFIFL